MSRSHMLQKFVSRCASLSVDYYCTNIIVAIRQLIGAQVRRGENGTWLLDSEHGGTGCSPQHGWNPMQWKHIKLSRGNDSVPVFLPRDIASDPVLTVRSSHDPEILGYHLADRMNQEVEPKLETWVVGVILLIIGLGALIPLLAMFLPQLLQTFVEQCRRGSTSNKYIPTFNI